ncbi:rho-related GTP-binding protein RhoV isoform X1 [Mastomys coucha]|uniref:rho-related GTP-binding protein RhoV isoform X1 n=1 Tax=Mastomys coucha TaxID=35658 RepID=UPI001261C675|nr:rho-related GTP-binding protein RhoV isoform X1 [Mastomys coucha]
MNSTPQSLAGVPSLDRLSASGCGTCFPQSRGAWSGLAPLLPRERAMPPRELSEAEPPPLPASTPPPRRRSAPPELGIKCVLVGDGAVGKSSLIVSYTCNGYPARYRPTALDTFSVQVLVDGAPVRIELWDTAGQEDFDRLRSLCYPDTDVFLACFSVVQPSSFQNITEKWLPEIRTHNPQAPVLLVGTQADLRDDVNVLIQLDQGGREGPVPHPQAQGLAEKIRACCYLECSALTQKNLKEVFDSAILSAIEHKARLEKKLNAKGVRTLSRCRWKKFFCFV